MTTFRDLLIENYLDHGVSSQASKQPARCLLASQPGWLCCDGWLTDGCQGELVDSARLVELYPRRFETCALRLQILRV